MAERKKLAIEIEIACDIYSLEAAGKPIWFSRIEQRYTGKYTKSQIARALDLLTDWTVIYGEYGPTEHGRAGYCYHIDDDHIDRVVVLYRDHYTLPPGADPGEPLWPRHLESRK